MLFIKDTGPSLQAALLLLGKFSGVSGLKVNWTKSKILPLRSHAVPGQADPDNPLQWVSHIKYLGLLVTNLVTDFINLMVSPLLGILSKKFHA